MPCSYALGKAVGQGGFGEVVVATDKTSGEEYACKCIRKRLDSTSFVHQSAHAENIKREVAILRRLKGTLNVAPIVAAFEDDVHVYVLLEYCRGGELWQHIGKLQYSERTVRHLIIRKQDLLQHPVLCDCLDVFLLSCSATLVLLCLTCVVIRPLHT